MIEHTNIAETEKYNPFATQPSYVSELVKALNNAPHMQPRSGGRQFSIRLDTAIAHQVEAIHFLTNWSRSDIVMALIQRGLFDLYEILELKKAKELLKKLNIPLTGFEHIQGENND